MSRRATIAVCAVVFLLIGAGLGIGMNALAADPSVHACVANNTGAARIVSATTACYSNEHALTWSITGPIGPIGPQGPTGATGATGAIRSHWRDRSHRPARYAGRHRFTRAPRRPGRARHQ